MVNTYDITVKNGKTYKGVLFTITINNIAFDLTDYNAYMQVRYDYNSELAFEISTVNGGLTIMDASAGKVQIDEQIFTELNPIKYKYAIEFRHKTNTEKIYEYIEGYFIVDEVIVHG
jgi:hypothetical protein